MDTENSTATSDVPGASVTPFEGEVINTETSFEHSATWEPRPDESFCSVTIHSESSSFVPLDASQSGLP